MNQDQLIEKQQQVKASVITLVITVFLFSIFFYVQYQQPAIPEPITGEGIEVNLGNAETGEGAIAPAAIGEPASEKTNAVSNPNEASATPNNSESDEDIAINRAAANEKPAARNAVSNNPPTPKPKAVFTGGTNKGSGGNFADSYNGVTNQGIAGGKGDQGKPNGNPNSDSYTGNAGSGNGGIGGVAIKSGLDGRRITKLPSFEDEFNENAKVAVDITVNQAGAVTAAVINPKGTTTTNPSIRNIALQKAKSLKLNAAEAEEQKGTLVFNFKLRN